jgi:AraC-like DNA-binding protein
MSFYFAEDKPSDSPFIEAIWHTQSESAGSFISTASTQSGIVLVRYQGQTTLTIRGPETWATPAPYPAEAEFLGINFKLGTFMPPFPAQLVMNRQDMTLPEARRGAFWIQGAAWEIPDFENADTFINRLVREGLLANDPIVEAAVQGKVEDLALRSVQRRFLHATGITLKTVQQIERAQKAAALLEQGCSILDTVYDLGYFDQSHLTNSLKRFIGQTPAQLLHPSE